MIIKIKKLSKSDNPLFEDSNYRDSAEFFQGQAINKPTIGESFVLYPSEINPDGIRTSRLTKVTENTFETLNSIYSWEIIEN